MPNKETKLQPELFDLTKIRVNLDDFLKPNGEKNNKIPTGMDREKIIELKKIKGKRGTRNADWPNEY